MIALVIVTMLAVPCVLMFGGTLLELMAGSS